MIIVHIYEYDTTDFENGLTCWIDSIFDGILAAPLLMFCMGAGMSIWLNMLALTIVSAVVYNKHFKGKVEGFCTRYRIVLILLVWVVTLGAAFYAFGTYTELPNAFNGYFLHRV